MLLHVRVVPRASRNLVKQESNALKVYLTKPAIDGLANKQLIELLSEYLNIKKYQVRIIGGKNSRNKTVEVSDGA